MPDAYNGIPGDIVLPNTVAIVDSTNATPIVVHAVAHGMVTGDLAEVVGHRVNTAANNRWAVSVVDADHVILEGSAGIGVGGATGTIQQLGFGAAYAIPRDGEKRTAMSVNAALEALGDRAALLCANMAQYKVFAIAATQVDDHATEMTAWTEAHTFAAGNTWEQIKNVAVTGPAILLTILDELLVGDVVEVSFTGSVYWNDSGSSGDGVNLSLYESQAPSAASPTWSTPAIVPGSAQLAPGAGPAELGAQGGVHLRGRFTESGAHQSVQLYLYGFTRNTGSPGNMSLTMRGDYQCDVVIYRATDFAGRVG